MFEKNVLLTDLDRWKNVKLMALLTLVVIFLIYLFVGFGCGLPAWSKCIG
jgi:vesicle-associated membrane protein 7